MGGGLPRSGAGVSNGGLGCGEIDDGARGVGAFG